ncbi:MAG: tetratricopeptide repeat protein [Synechococcales bacterium]|jgi:tetratricopeptide (TPR) repeat protein|nr:tetratricopeptide repeat protein [Cyanobacteria bacterium REEB444]MEB3124396.1 tetratricopeptide repeat protein [Synechococcales bacterium]NBO31241.1 tetratricopeptide repeat protein [Cyanobacteria bacterium WB6_1B_304]
MELGLPTIYLSLLVILLGGASWFIFRQIIRTRAVEKTLSSLRTKLNTGKGDAQDYYELGSIYLDKKIYSQAIVQFQQALKAKDLVVGENTALIYNALGFAYACQEQYDLAMRQYKEAIKQKPDYVKALNNLGFAYERKQMVIQALGAYETALNYQPDNPTAQKRADSLRKRLVSTER